MTGVMHDSLYALAPRYAEALAEMEALEGDISDAEFAARFNAINQAFGERIEACQMVFRHRMADAKALQEFARPYIERAARLEREAEQVKRYTFACLQTAGQIRVETPLGGARLQNSPPSVTVTCDPHDLPIAYTRTVVEPDKVMLLDAWKAQLELPPGVSVEVGRHLRWL